MKTFKEYITESTAYKTAKKALDDLHNKHGGDIPTTSQFSRREANSVDSAYSRKLDSKKWNAKENTRQDVKIPINKLRYIQSEVDREGVLRHLRKKKMEPIHVLKYKGRHYIGDGNHRAFGASLRGDRHIIADITDLDR